ncbi:MAG: META domain-containing protein [Chloroflexales bacterium]|nr:META domain-containing protein [Chloroflexales bacterium]
MQWFERARFEIHPENPALYTVLFGRLGAELSGSQAGSPSLALTGREWRLVSFGPVGAPTPAVAESAATFSFSDSTVTGSTGCNRFNGPYQATAETITFGQLASPWPSVAMTPCSPRSRQSLPPSRPRCATALWATSCASATTTVVRRSCTAPNHSAKRP